MTITGFRISDDKQSMIIDLEAIDTSSYDLYLYTSYNYEDTTNATVISWHTMLNEKVVNNLVNQTITLTINDFNEDGITLPYFDGVYILTGKSGSSNKDVAVTYDFTRYNECVLDKVLEIGVCDECLKHENHDLINASVLIQALIYAVEEKFIDEIVDIVTILDLYCSDDCKSCKEKGNDELTDYYRKR